MSGRNRVMFSKPEEPAFLRKIKEKIGYQEGPTVDTKHEELPQANEDDFRDREDEKPVVVLLDNGKVDEDEAKAFIEKLNQKTSPEDAPFDPNRRIIFKKRDRSDAESKSKLSLDSRKKPRRNPNIEVDKNISRRTQESSNRTKNTSNQLLSFDSDDE
ncbi:uncharacterized protein KIAA1143 homolog [Brevipalpus obovatus]|uniref:uncharacterized protein KIAA1143 homolog n=1 Tax=Brevipalpus obovatus TaxID=246614 RepID=UPI003D9E0C7E